MIQSLNILAVDDVEMNLEVIDRYLASVGHKVVKASSGEEALKVFQEIEPDVVLMDVMMPGMDGYETTKRIRQLNADKWVPVIFVSALSENIDQIRGLDAGGDDYLTKPINLGLLEAKIKAMQRIADMQRELAETTLQLRRYHEDAELEQEIAHELMVKMVSGAHCGDPALQVWQENATRFSGDLVAAIRNKTGKLYVLGADSMGHGLPAALPLLPVSQTFYEMAEEGFSVSSIVDEMNSQLHRQMPVGRFVTATVCCFDFPNKVIDIWNGANPEAIFVEENGSIARSFVSRNAPLGVEGSEIFDSRSQTWQWDKPGRLVMYSDGVLDAQNAAGEMLGEEKISDILIKNSTDVFNAISGLVKNHLGDAQPKDDISLMVVNCNGAGG